MQPGQAMGWEKAEARAKVMVPAVVQGSAAARRLGAAARMILKRARSAFALSLVLTAFQAPGAEGPDAARGRVLYERHCITCHAPGIHGRTTRTPLTRDELRMLVDTFRRQANLGWTRDEIDDVVEHLSLMAYRFPPEKER